MLGCAQIALPPVLGVGPTAFGNIPVDPFAALGEVQDLAQGGENPVRQDRRPGADGAVQGVDLVAPQRLELLLALAGQDMPGPVAFLLGGMLGRNPGQKLGPERLPESRDSRCRGFFLQHLEGINALVEVATQKLGPLARGRDGSASTMVSVSVLCPTACWHRWRSMSWPVMCCPEITVVLQRNPKIRRGFVAYGSLLFNQWVTGSSPLGCTSFPRMQASCGVDL